MLTDLFPVRALLCLPLVVGLLVSMASVAQANGFNVSVRIDGVPKGELLDTLIASSSSMAEGGGKQEEIGRVMARARDDKGLFEKILRSYGYYRPRVQIRVGKGSGADQIELFFSIIPGPLYRLEEVTFIWNVAHPIPQGVSLKGVHPGQGVNAGKIIGAEEALINELHEKGYPFAKALPREVTIDHASRAGVLIYRVDQGPSATFGETTFVGIEGIDPVYLSHRIPWRQGEPVRLSALEEFRKRLEATSLFSRVKVGHKEAPDETGHLAVTATTLQRATRTISAGVYYRSDDKLGAKAGWEHRNFTGHADRLRFRADVSALRREGSFDYRLPEFYDERLSLNLNGIAADESTIAYTSRYQDGSVSIDVRVIPWLTVGIGGGGRRGETTTKATGKAFNYLLGYGIAFATIDQTDVPLDPAWGLRMNGWAEPYYGESEGDISFLKARGDGELFVTYAPDGWSATLALRGELGALFGADFDRVPPDLRYYAGGAGSIRGYPYQSVGPELNDIPTGGRSVLAGSVEGRFRFGPAWGAVLFLDGGAAYKGETPDYETAPLFGAGIGVRYTTGFGPVRVDIAVPLSRRESDPPFQVYVGLGQAF